MEIVDYRPEHARAFHDLNLAWISKLFEVEAKDLEVIEDPEGKIIAKGGKIFMAVDGGRAVGCVAMIAMEEPTAPSLWKKKSVMAATPLGPAPMPRNAVTSR